MSRPSLRRTPKLESLETRQVLSTVIGPTPDQQYALELINLVRTNPSGAAVKFTSDITPDVQATLDHFGVSASDLKSQLNSATPQPPLAWSDALGSTAQAQSQYQADHGVQTHQGPGQDSLGGRISSAGYTNVASFGENTYAYADNVDEAMQSFLFDWGVADHGHFRNLLQPGTSAADSYKDVGIGLVKTSGQGLGPMVVTQDFGSRANEAPQVLGVVYDDPNGSGFYTPGKGQAGVTIDVVNLTTGEDAQTHSTNSGGYQLPVAANADYKVTATENGHVIASRQVHVGSLNVKADFVHDPVNDSAPTPAPTPAPAPIAVAATPTPAPVQVPAPAPAPVQVPAQSTPSQPTATDEATKAQATPQADQQAAPAQPVDQPQVLIPMQQDSATPTSGSNDDASIFSVTGWSHWTAGRSVR